MVRYVKLRILNFIFIFFAKLSVNCEWGDWEVGFCSKTCGGGERINQRTPFVKAAFGGVTCSGPSNVTEECNKQECPGRIFSRYHSSVKSNFPPSILIL